jgi:predicted DsbA family dithiol-disulfide isomerase
MGEPPTTMVQGAAIVVWSDILCPWAHVAVHRLLAARRQAGLDDELVVDHRALPLELLGDGPLPEATVRAAAEVLAGHEPGAGWGGPGDPWPVTSFAPLAAVQAAKALGVAAAERLDLALRRALFGDGRCVSLYPVVLDVADDAGLDRSALLVELRSGRPAAAVWSMAEEAAAARITTSPTVALGDGSIEVNPGIEHRWEGGEPGRGRLIVERDDTAAHLHLVERAMAAKEFD